MMHKTESQHAVSEAAVRQGVALGGIAHAKDKSRLAAQIERAEHVSNTAHELANRLERLTDRLTGDSPPDGEKGLEPVPSGLGVLDTALGSTETGHGRIASALDTLESLIGL